MRTRRTVALAGASVAVVALGFAAEGSAGSAGPTARPAGAYRVETLGSLGGTSSVGNSISNQGWVVGRSNLAGDEVRHATLWRGGNLVDLGTLGGPRANSAVLWPVENARGIVSGVTQTRRPDRLGENWSCSFFFPAATATGRQCIGFRWQRGEMTPLPTLGGTHGFATGTNNRGQTAGWAENTVRDPSCEPPQVLQFRAVVWGRGGEPRELSPLGDDSVSAATALNDHGEVVGISGRCDQAVGRFSAVHAVLWRNRRVIDLGDLGGEAWNTPMAVSQRGDVVGFANSRRADGGELDPRAFLWTRAAGMRPLGRLDHEPGATSQALGVNERRQVVGTSCDAVGSCRAFVWDDGEMVDLNAVVDPDFTGTVTSATDIDDRGRITGQALLDSGERVAFVATPVQSAPAR